MHIWPLQPQTGSLRVEPAAISDLLASITEPDSSLLPRAILNLVRGEVEAINCAIFLLPAGGQPWLMGHAQVPGRHHVPSVGGSYADSYYQRDLSLQHALRLSREDAGRTMLLHHNASDIHDHEYRLRCYEEVDTRQRFAVVRPINERDSLMVGIYRASAAMSSGDLAFLSQTARWVGEAAVQRLRARPPAGVAAEEAILALESRLRVRLSHRERQVLLAMVQARTLPATAQGLGVALTSVVTYRNRALAKLGLGSRHELLRAVVEEVGALAAARSGA
ncbi:helix-turn-helix transcriptional regulator [Comamonas composti]|uniref:helix-turn-helix transcriptional regulator n=1 Tax=Comamonas composti TaxID=408558 RepID=UPI00040D0859|nr:LuxR C-terminal-related transcriptional regulator [Comamonas composti]